MKRQELGRYEQELPPGCMGAKVAEIDGFIGLGMKREALQLARKCFLGEKADSGEFFMSLNALLTMETGLKRWRNLVNAGYEKLSKRGKRHVRPMMLSFYYSLNDYREAEKFLPRRYHSPMWLTELCFALDTKLMLGKVDEARPIAQRAMDALKSADNEFGRELLVSGVAKYLLETKQWESAISLWEMIQDDDCMAESATFGLIELHLQRTLDTIHAGFKALANLRQQHDPDLETIIPGNQAARWREMEPKLRRVERAVRRALKASGCTSSEASQ